MSVEPRSPQFQKQLTRIEELVHSLEQQADSAAAGQARELLQALLELHGSALERTLEIVYDSDSGGPALIDQLAADPLVSNLMLLHGLHPLDLETRIRQALHSVKPRLGLHGGDVQLIGVTPEGVVKLRLEGNCHGCPSSRITLKTSIEEAIYAAAPDTTALEVEGAVDQFEHAPNGAQPKFTVCPTNEELKASSGGTI